MYKDYYHLQSEPFSTHPNTGTFFISNTHKEAWYYLLFGIDTQEPFIVLTGEYGMGKTLLCLRLIKLLKEKGMPRVEYIPTSNEGYGGILRRMASGLGISPIPEDEEILQDMIYDRFRADTENLRFYLIIDDAHELDTAVLTKLKYLSTFNHNEFFPVIMIFVGHPSFLQDLKTPALNSLNQRIKRRYHLARFNLEDTKNYIYFRLMKSGATGIPAFSDETIQKIFDYSGGVPRLINNICDTCLLIGASRQLISIPPSVVDDAKNLVEGSLTGSREEPGIPELTDDVAADRREERTAVVFSKDLPAGGTVKQPPVVATEEVDEYQQEAERPKKSAIYQQALKRWMAPAVVLIVLLLAISWVYQHSSDGGIGTLFPPANVTPQQAAPLPPEKGVVGIPSDKSGEDVPTLREETTDKSVATSSSAIRPETPALSSVEVAPKRSDVTEPSGSAARVEAVAAGSPETFPLHPYSLRASSYQLEERAAQELSEIRQMGLSPYLVKADLGDLGILWRVYIGFYASEEEAKKAKAAHKLSSATVQRTDYACQVGEFSNETDGLNILAKLKKAGYSPYAIQKGRSLFRIYLGAYESKSEAESLQQRLQQKGIKSQVVKR
jgi:type II secretory pathway predicted ATPase ExeA/cell division septation protein DedD